MFCDLFYFRKRFQKICCINDMQLLLHDEMIYCELVQWINKCDKVHANVVAQYLGTLNELLFPPQMCSNAGIDLLMRPAKHFPGILSPKIEVATKLRIDEIWDNPQEFTCDPCSSPCTIPKGCLSMDTLNKKYQKPVCHSTEYHSSPHCNAKFKSGCSSKCRIQSVTLQRNPIPRKTYTMDHKLPPYCAHIRSTVKPKCVPEQCYGQQEVCNFASCQEIPYSKEVHPALFDQPVVSDLYNPSLGYHDNFEPLPYYYQDPTVTYFKSNECENYRFESEQFNCTPNQNSNLQRIHGQESLNVERGCFCGSNGKQRKQRRRKLRSADKSGQRMNLDSMPSCKLEFEACSNPGSIHTKTVDYECLTSDTDIYPNCNPENGTQQDSDDCDRLSGASDRSVANDMCLDSKLQSEDTCSCRRYMSLLGKYSYRKLSSPVPYNCEICKKYEMLFNNNNNNTIKCCGQKTSNTRNGFSRQSSMQ